MLLHGMMQDWRSEYELLKPLEEHDRLIIPVQDGFYEDSTDFTLFADQVQQIEEYVRRITRIKLMAHRVHRKVV